MLTARTGLSPVMVGRSGPLGRLTTLLREPQSDERPAVALVTGESGLGKTRLVQELIAAAPPGTVMLAGGAEQGALGRPFEVVRSLLADDGGPIGPTSQAIVESVIARVGTAPALIVFED